MATKKPVQDQNKPSSLVSVEDPAPNLFCVTTLQRHGLIISCNSRFVRAATVFLTDIAYARGSPELISPSR